MRALLLPLCLLTSCAEVQQAAKEAAVQLTFCDQLPQQLPPTAAPVLDPAAMLTCMHPLAKLEKSTTTTTITGCKDAENWEFSQTLELGWSGLLKEYKASVKVDYRVVGGYLSVRRTKVFDEAVFEGKEDCTNGQWIQSDQKVVDVKSIVDKL